MTPEQFDAERAAFEANISIGQDAAAVTSMLAREGDFYRDAEINGIWGGWIVRAEKDHIQRRESQKKIGRLTEALKHLHYFFETERKLISKRCGSEWGKWQCEAQMEIIAAALNEESAEQ